MTDEKIVELYWERDNAAISETKQKYGNYLFKIAHNVLGSLEDCEESVNDTYLKAWNSIPPQRPENLSVYLGKIVRENSIDIYRKSKRKKRSSEYEISLDELGECVSGTDTAEALSDTAELSSAISRFLKEQKEEKRRIFVMRYFYLDSVAQVAEKCGCSEAKIKSCLHRMRKELKKHLQKEEFIL